MILCDIPDSGVEWNGLDTLVIAAGVSALQPLLAIAGLEVEKNVELQMTTREGIQNTVDVAAAATRGNYVGPLVAAVTFVSTTVSPFRESNRKCQPFIKIGPIII